MCCHFCITFGVKNTLKNSQHILSHQHQSSIHLKYLHRNSLYHSCRHSAQSGHCTVQHVAQIPAPAFVSFPPRVSGSRGVTYLGLSLLREPRGHFFSWWLQHSYCLEHTMSAKAACSVSFWRSFQVVPGRSRCRLPPPSLPLFQVTFVECYKS